MRWRYVMGGAAVVFAVGIWIGANFFAGRQGGGGGVTATVGSAPLASAPSATPAIALIPPTADTRDWPQIKEDAWKPAEEADQELNAVYQQLESILDVEEKPKLITAERAWIAFRDAECIFESEYTGFGTDRTLFYADAVNGLTRQRIETLREQFKWRAPQGQTHKP